MLLKVGEKAPVFSLPDADMATVDLANYQGQKHMNSCGRIAYFSVSAVTIA